MLDAEYSARPMTPESASVDGRLEVVDLVDRARNGDKEAFSTLVRLYERHVLSVALRRLGDFSEAEEVMQEVMLQAWLKIGQLREPKAFASWLRAITTSITINRVTRRRVRECVDTDGVESSALARESTPLEFLVEREEEDRLSAGMGRLGDMDRETLENFHYDRLSLNEMAEKTGCPVGTIKRRLHVARNRLAEQVLLRDPPVRVARPRRRNRR